MSHDTLISKIAGSSPPPAITRWLSCYLRGRQATTSFRDTKSSTRIVRTGVPQGSKLSPSVFNYYIADMPRPTPSVKRVCYADDITVWATGPKIPQLESMINSYMREVFIYLKDNSLLIYLCAEVNNHALHPGQTLNLHTHAVDSAIQLQGNNRALKKRPPPISDEEQRLNRRQRCTLSQLRSGHCHLLQDYKHRVLGEPSDICTDCGASPQDVRHMFACTTHPTDLSPEDLWRNQVGSIRAFSYLDNGNLD